MLADRPERGFGPVLERAAASVENIHDTEVEDGVVVAHLHRGSDYELAIASDLAGGSLILLRRQLLEGELARRPEIGLAE
jgi:hypothetical protein